MVSVVDIRERELEERKIKEKLDLERQKQLQKEIEEDEKRRKFKKQKRAIKDCGLLEAYDLLLDDLVTKGLPPVKMNGDIFEYAAFFLAKYHRNKTTEEYEEREERLR